jgi:hypothetical protein
MRAISEPLAAPQMLADYFLSRAHNRSNRKSVAHMITIQSPTRAIRFPVPCSIFAVSSPKIRHTPTPPTCGNHFFDPSINNNNHSFNNLHFRHVNESVTENPVFCPLLAPKKAIFARKALIFAFPESPQVPQFGILELGIQELFASNVLGATSSPLSS